MIRPRGGTARRGGDGQDGELASEPESVGTQLGRARAERGLDLLAVHDRLGRPITQLEALETGNMAALSDEALAISTLRRYATFLGLDGDALADQFVLGAGVDVRRLGGPVPGGRPQRRGRRHHRSRPPAGVHRNRGGPPGRGAGHVGRRHLGELRVRGLGRSTHRHLSRGPPGRSSQGPAPGGPSPAPDASADQSQGRHLDRRCPGPHRRCRVRDAGGETTGPCQRPYSQDRPSRLGGGRGPGRRPGRGCRPSRRPSDIPGATVGIDLHQRLVHGGDQEVQRGTWPPRAPAGCRSPVRRRRFR